MTGHVIDWPQPPRPTGQAAAATSALDDARQAQADAIKLAADIARGAHATLIEGALQATEAAGLTNQKPGVAAELRRIAVSLEPALQRLKSLLAHEPG